MARPTPALAALWLLAACASAPAPEPAPEPLPEAIRAPTELYGPRIEAAANALLAAEPAGTFPPGLEVVVQSIEESAAGLFYTADLRHSGRRRAQDFVIYGQCAADDLDACAAQIVAGARMLKRGD